MKFDKLYYRCQQVQNRYFVESICTIPVLSCGKNLWNTFLKVSIFSKTTDLQPATLQKMNSYLRFYQSSLELSILKWRIIGVLFLLFVSQG